MYDKNVDSKNNSNIPGIELPQNCHREPKEKTEIKEPLPESTRPRRDGPGGD